jgi:predicted N-acetyltransferase YhbS
LLIRPATPGDLPALVAGADAIFRTPPRPGLRSMGDNYPLLFGGQNSGNLLVAVAPDGRIVAHAGFTLRGALLAGQPARVACFGAVFTAADLRGHGLGSGVFRAAVDRARAAGADIGLVSGARGLYQRVGFDSYPLCRRYRVPAGAAPAVALVPYDQAAVDDLVRLHDSEATRFRRSPDEWRALAGAGVVFHHPGRLLLVTPRAGGPPIAYLAVATPAAPLGDRGPRVLELAGDRGAIADAAPELARTLGLPAIDVILPPHDDSLAALAAERAWAADLVAPVACMFQRWTPALSQLPLPFYGLDYV